MKKWIAAALLLCLGISLFSGCATGGAEETTAPISAEATAEDIAHLEGLYEGKTVSYGDMHVHSASSERSDGKIPLSSYATLRELYQIDYMAIVDHGQSTHMWHEEWDDTCFIGGTEPGLRVEGVEVISKDNMDYEMIFTELEGLEAVFNQYPELYEYDKATGYAKKQFKADRAKIQEVIQCIKDNGGMWVHVHPFAVDQYYGYNPVDYMNYWFADEVGFEITNGGFGGGMRAKENTDAYECWVKLINAGKRVWATCGGDGHTVMPPIWSLSTIYTAEKNGEGYFRQMKVGNLTAGPVGVRICVGDNVTGSTTSFEGQRVVIAGGDFHPQIIQPGNVYRLDVYDENGLVTSKEMSTTEMNYVAFDARKDAKYYRADVYNVTANCLVAAGNPVFNG